jgi:hypothetical protein
LLGRAVTEEKRQRSTMSQVQPSAREGFESWARNGCMK